jgi:adenosylhomocysteine nucleosidase
MLLAAARESRQADVMELANDARVAFVCAMPMELTPLVEKLSLTETKVGDVTVHSGTLHGREVVAIVTGMGVDYASSGTAALLDAMPVDHVVVVGITGGMENETPIGTLILPELVVHSVTGAEYRPAPLGEGTPHGKMVTTVGLTTDDGAMAELRAQGVVSLDMETAAIAHLCDERGVPWSVFRVISDRPDSNITDELFQMSNLDGTPNQEAIDAYFAKHPDAMDGMAKLAEDATLAANLAADAAIRACSPSSP